MAGPGTIRGKRAQRAIVIGGSMSGLLAALMLQRRGWDVHRALIEFDDPRYARNAPLTYLFGNC